MMRRLLVLLALVSACSSSEPPAPEKVEEPAPAPEPETEPAVDDDASDAMKMALLGGGKKDEADEAEPEADPVAEPEPTRKRKPQPKQKKQASSDSSRTRLPPSPSLPEPPARLSDAQFEGVVGDWRGVKSCVATNRPRGGEVQNGALSVQFTIAGNGAVEAARVEETSGAFARTLAPCVERKAMRLSFPDFGGKEAVTRSAKFVF